MQSETDYSFFILVALRSEGVSVNAPQRHIVPFVLVDYGDVAIIRI